MGKKPTPKEGDEYFERSKDRSGKEVDEFLDQNRDRIEESVREGQESRKRDDGCGYDLDDDELNDKP
jgi:hypothetical protein